MAAISSERQQLTKQVQDVQKKVRCRAVDVTGEDETNAQTELLSEFNEAQVFRGREISTVECEKMMKEAPEVSNVRIMKKMEHKLVVVSIYLFVL